MLRGLLPNTRLYLAWAACMFPIACSGGCDRTDSVEVPTESRPGRSDPTAPGLVPGAASPSADAGASLTEAPSGEAPAEAQVDAGLARSGWPGPVFTVTSTSAGIYAQPTADRTLKIGYARSGGHIPVLAETVLGEGCRSGWYQLVGGGYICGAEGTTNPGDPRARLAVQAPDLNAILPYPYARNVHNGTPLYSSVPSADQIATYEPRLEAEDRLERDTSLEREANRPWWQKAQAPLSEVRLAQLALESDGLLARRMVKGFYIAVDKEFEWSDRTWYKTTKGLVAPKDRFVAVEGATFKGVELNEHDTLPLAWAYGFRQTRPKYERNPAGKFKQVGELERLEPVHLVGDVAVVDGHGYLQSDQGFWVQSDHVRVARTPPIPSNLGPDERWIHVDLRSQVLVALIGAKPIFATLVSSGKESEDEAQDHRTPPGEWNIREKHVTTTMDGDGTAAGDLPYSIEDVPYVMYFQGSYALHGAFWHRNFGVRMSHGCINLAPLDAKYLFFFTGPAVREGWHGAWSGNGQAGTRLVIDGPVRGSPAGH
jgi:lipoprotein-anchoring transpeptidase ErfK/SrfK